jgi:hypothetical protein
MLSFNVIAQNPTSSVAVDFRIYWANGSEYTGPGTLHFAGCSEQGSIDFDHISDVHFIPLLCESTEVWFTGEADVKTGVTVLDLIRLSKHLLGIDPFTNALQLIAADANNSQSVSAIDMIEIRKVILGSSDSWPSNKTLKFILKTTPAPPAIGAQLSSSVKVLPGQTGTIEFWIVKTGDIQ